MCCEVMCVCEKGMPSVGISQSVTTVVGWECCLRWRGCFNGGTQEFKQLGSA